VVSHGDLCVLLWYLYYVFEIFNILPCCSIG